MDGRLTSRNDLKLKKGKENHKPMLGGLIEKVKKREGGLDSSDCRFWNFGSRGRSETREGRTGKGVLEFFGTLGFESLYLLEYIPDPVYT